MTELEFQTERAAKYATAIGLARFYLEDGQPEAAKYALDHAVRKVHEMTRADLIARGNDPVSVDRFLGSSVSICDCDDHD